MGQRFRAPRPFVALVVGLAFFILCGLGVWQLQRLAWKTALIETVTRNLAATPGTLSRTPAEFDHVRVMGAYTGQEFFFGGKYQAQVLGYHVYAPLKLDDGRVLLVNRGWIATADRDHAAARTTTGPVEVTGIVRFPLAHRWFLPDNVPEKNVWFRQDMRALSRAANAPLEPYYLEEVAGPFANERTPAALTGEVRIPNDHLQYAVTWFLFAGVLLTMFAVGHRQRDARV